MSIRKGNSIISGIDTGDGKSITRNSSSQLQSIGVIDNNVQNAYNFTVVGSPNITDNGIASGFSDSDYLTFTGINLTNASTFDIYGDFITNTVDNLWQYILRFTNYGMYIEQYGDNLLVSISTTGSGYNDMTTITGLVANTHYYYHLEYDGLYKFYLKTDNTEWELKWTGNESGISPNLISSAIGYIGSAGTSSYFRGSIDLKQLSITVDGVEVYRAWQSPALKYWTGTKAQYDAIATKNTNTLYNVTDDTNATLSLLELLYPVGAIYIGTMSTCPLATLGVGTWQLKATDRVLQGAGTRGSVGTTVSESLPNITGEINDVAYPNNADTGSALTTGANPLPDTTNGWIGADVNNASVTMLYLDASRSSSTYQDNAPVQQDAYIVNIWERIS